MSLLVAWGAFPLLLLALGGGWGLLVEGFVRTRVPRALVPGVGLCALIAVTELLLVLGPANRVATPVAVAGAAAGWLAATRRPTGLRAAWRGGRWALLAAAAAFAVFAAPIVLSGEATFSGYIKLDDTATWLALTDQIAERGRDLSGLAPSTHEVTLAFTLGKGYPVGSMLPLAIGSRLIGQDAAWLVAPYMATLAAILALGLWSLCRGLVTDPRIRAAAAFVAVQPALLYGDYLWGGLKEVLAAAVIATGFALAAAIRGRAELRLAIPLAIVAVALADSLSLAGMIWLAPALGLVGVRLWRSRPPISRRLAVAILAGCTAIATPALAMAGYVSPLRRAFTGETELGNLISPLSPFHLAGIWPATDFRFSAEVPLLSTMLIAIVCVAAVAGLAGAARRGAIGPLLYVLGSLAVAIATWLFGSPWIAAKAFAIAAPCLLLVAMAGAAVLWDRSRAASIVVLAAISGGVLWSNALAYQGASLAPRGQLAELEEIGGRIAGQGPTLMTEYEPYGARHFLRNADAEGASELRRRPVTLRGGGTLDKGDSADTDGFRLDTLMTYRTLVLRRSPAESRPPSPYRLTWTGRYYEVWQRPLGAQAEVIDHLGLGGGTRPGGVAPCRAMHRLAHHAGPRGRLAAVRRAPVEEIDLRRTTHPVSWESSAFPTRLVPTSPGSIRARFRVTRPGRYEIWLGGSVRPQAELAIDGRPAGRVRDQLNNRGSYVRLGGGRLGAGAHMLSIEVGGADLHPGSGGAPTPIGPLLVGSQDAAGTRISHFRPREAPKLCGKRWDWVEALAR